MQAPLKVWKALNQPDSVETKNFKKLEPFMLEIFQGEGVLNKELARVSGISIFNAALESIDKPDLDAGGAR